jgi:hypothetical protein
MPMGNPQARSLYLTMESTSANITVTNGPTTLIQKHTCPTGKSFKGKKQKNKNKMCAETELKLDNDVNRVTQENFLILLVLKAAYDNQSAQVTQRFT